MSTTTLRQSEAATAAIGFGVIVILGTVIGAAIVGGEPLGAHHLERAAIVGLPVLLVAAVLIDNLGARALPFWVVLSPLAYPFLRYPTHSGGYITFDRLWLVGLLLILVRLPRPSSPHPASRRLAFAMVLLAAVYGLRLLDLPHVAGQGHFTEVRLWVDGMVLPLIVYAFTRRFVLAEGEGRVVRALVVAGVVVSVISLAELVFGFSLADLSGGTSIFDAAAGVPRVSGPYASNASSSTVALICLAAAVYWIRRSSGRSRLTPILAAVIIAAGALASFHRAAGIAVVAVLVLGSLAGTARRTGRVLILSGCAIVAAFAFFVVAGRVEHTQFWQGRIASNTNVLGRFASWEQGVKIFDQAPLIGVGPGRAPIVQQREGLVQFHGQTAAITLHSSFLTLLAENGLIGELALLFLCAAVLRLILALRRRRQLGESPAIYAAVLAAGAGYLVMSLTLTMLLESPASLMFAVLLGLAAGHLDRPSSGAADAQPVGDVGSK